MEKVGRNELCPCGSGQKYKKCCLGRDEDGPPTPTSAPGVTGSVSAELLESLQGRSFGSLKEMNAYLGWQVSRRNRQATPDFEGLSPEQMHGLLYAPFDSPQLVTFSTILAVAPDEAPIVRLFTLLMAAIGEEGLKPTATGNLPRSVCREIALAFYGEDGYREETRYGGINTEPDFSELHVTRLIGELAGFVRKYRGKFITGREYRQLSAREGMTALYPRLFEAFVQRYEWGYLDRYPELTFIQTSFLFTLRLLSRYGDQWRPESFYVEHYLRAFPSLFENAPELTYWTPEQLVGKCYSLRTLQRFAEFMGLVEIERIGNKLLPDEIRIRKLALLEAVVSFHR